jgi:hypothetical protein
VATGSRYAGAGRIGQRIPARQRMTIMTIRPSHRQNFRDPEDFSVA